MVKTKDSVAGRGVSPGKYTGRVTNEDGEAMVRVQVVVLRAPRRSKTRRYPLL